jgi:hypothetical protein
MIECGHPRVVHASEIVPANDLLPGISAVVPVYNGEATLGALLSRLGPVLAGVAPSYEVVLVNDGSRDGSWAAIEALAARHAWVRGLDLMRNYGQHNALLAGVRAARYATVVTLDDDLQNPPEEIPRLLQALDTGLDVVYGTPHTRQHGVWRNLTSELIKLPLRIGMPATAAGRTSSFRAFRTGLRDAFAGYESPYVSLDVLLSWGTLRFGTVPVRHDARSLGRSNYTLTRTTGFTTWPLRLPTLLGAAVTAGGVALPATVAATSLARGRRVPRTPLLASLVAVLSGTHFLALGIIAEYLAQVQARTMGRPSSAIRRTTGPIAPGELSRDIGHDPGQSLAPR